MTKDLLISEILTLNNEDQHAILQVLQNRLADDLILDDTQERELDRRLNRIETEGYKGRPFDVVLKELEKKVSPDARHTDR